MIILQMSVGGGRGEEVSQRRDGLIQLVKKNRVEKINEKKEEEKRIRREGGRRRVLPAHTEV